MLDKEYDISMGELKEEFLKLSKGESSRVSIQGVPTVGTPGMLTISVANKDGNGSKELNISVNDQFKDQTRPYYSLVNAVLGSTEVDNIVGGVYKKDGKIYTEKYSVTPRFTNEDGVDKYNPIITKKVYGPKEELISTEEGDIKSLGSIFVQTLEDYTSSNFLGSKLFQIKRTEPGLF